MLVALATPGDIRTKGKARQGVVLTWSPRGHGRSRPGSAVAAPGRDLAHVLALQHRHQRGLPHVVGVAQTQLPKGNKQQLMISLQLSKQKFRADGKKILFAYSISCDKKIFAIYMYFHLLFLTKYCTCTQQE